MKLRLTVSALVLFIIAIGFNIFFNLTSFEKLYVESVISQYRVIGKDIQRSLEKGIRYGKHLENFFGIEDIVADAKKRISDKISRDGAQINSTKINFDSSDIFLLIVSTDGKIVAGEGAGQPREILSDMVHAALATKSKKSKDPQRFHYNKTNEFYFTTLSVKNIDKYISGHIVLFFKEQQIGTFLKDIFMGNVKPAIAISITGFITLLFFLLIMIPAAENKNQYNRKKVAAGIFVIIGTSLVLTCTFSAVTFKKHFFAINKENTTLINEQLKRDVEYLLSVGARIEKLAKLDVYLGEIIADSPEIENITLYDHTNQPLYRATKKGVTDFQRSKDCYLEWIEATKPQNDNEYNIRSELHKGMTFRGYFSTNVSREIMFEKLIDIVMDSLTVIIISMLFFVELMIMIFKYFEVKVQPANASRGVNYGVMRPAAFLFLFGIDISVSFLPLHMENLYIPIFNLSKEVIMGLPISVEFMFVGIAILISGVWLDRRGWHEPFVCGLVIAAFGVLYSWLAPDAIHFIVSRAIVGIGYGLSLMAAQGFVINYTDWKSKAQGLAHLFAGIYAGSICGTATGGMLAEWMGYTSVFMIGALILIAVVVYTFVFMREGMKKPEAKVQINRSAKIRGKTFHFLFNRTILGLIFFSSLPAAIAVIGFMNYFSPIYLNRIGASQSTIGQVLMLYGICLIYFGPFLSKYVDASQNKKVYILLGCFLGSAALLTFHIFEGLTAAIIAVLLFGLSSSFVLASQSVYALKLKVTQELGEGKAIGIFRSTSRVGQMLGPIVFSAVIAATNISSGITFLGLAYLCTALLFLVVTHSDIKAVLLEDA
jgi:predicted MFS family arabinose efflux permease